jgi:hypothetical protein
MTSPNNPATPAAERRGLFALIADVPRLLGDLVRAELASLQAELAAKAKAAGRGAGILAVAALVAFLAIFVLLAAAVLALALVLPAWAAALIVAVVLLVIAGVIAAVGAAQLKKALPPTPTDTIDSVKDDVRAVRGLRK